MMDVMTVLYQQIDNAHNYQTYRTQAPEGADFPYAVYKLSPIASTETGRDDYMLEVSCWDKPEGTSDKRVLELADNIRTALINFMNLDNSNLLFMDRPYMGHIPDSDAQIKRYDVTTILKTYRR
ncbi:hypothetical protein ACLIBH_07560 [Virgibacillus sp. W0430]|uniref:hypothetical protein n=1 Tax=Virgibacillus sp. W0430 TaxID=3391580 RepID=UPI003F46DB82